MTEENEYAEIDFGPEGENKEGGGIKRLQEDALADFKNYIQSEEFLALDEFGRIKATMQKMGVELKDPPSNCKKCDGRGWTGRRKETREPLMCPCVQPDMNEETQKAYDERANVPKNRTERRAMLKQVTKSQGNHTKKVKTGKK